MPRTTTTGRLLLESAVPEDMRASIPTFTGKTVSAFFGRLAVEHPDRYREVLRDLSRIGAEVGEYQGRESSIGTGDLRELPEVAKLRADVRAKVDAITQDRKLSPDRKVAAVVSYIKDNQDRIRSTVLEAAGKTGNPLAHSVSKGLRGSNTQLAQILFGDLLVSDHKGRPIPVPGLQGYGQGVTPMEYFAGSYGARQGMASVQLGTMQGGYYAKLMSLASQRLKVTGKDCGATDSGLEKDGSNPHIVGYVLTNDVNGIPAGTPIEKKHLPKLAGQQVTVRTLATCRQPEGVCQTCAGRREQGRFPAIGDQVGLTASMDVTEPITQILNLCLAEGTLVRMADWSTKRIENIVPGDMVIGCSVDGHRRPARVIDTFDSGLKGCGRLVTADDKIEAMCTAAHIVLGAGKDDRGKVHASKATGVAVADDMDSPLRVESASFEYYGLLHTRDIEIDHPDHLFLLANGLIVSNSAKHSGGTIGVTDKKGMEELQQFTGVPERFVGAAALAPVDGLVQDVKPAPQGGWYVSMASEGKSVRTYVPAGHPPTVKKGDDLEAGDVMSGGTPNPADIVRYKGLGEGRRYAAQKFREILDSNGVGAHDRNIEATVAGWLNRVRITDPDGWRGYRMDELVPYNRVQAQWKPRDGSEELAPSSARSGFLEKPVLHYTVGTRVTPKLARKLSDAGVRSITVHRDPPPFEAEAIRVVDVPSTDPDWKVRLTGFNLKKTLGEAAALGAVSDDVDSTSAAAALMNPTLL
jgi:hypothetical protein